MLYQMVDCPEEELLSGDDGWAAANAEIDAMEDEGIDWTGADSPTDFDEHEMNPEDCFEDAGDQYDFEYDH